MAHAPHCSVPHQKVRSHQLSAPNRPFSSVKLCHNQTDPPPNFGAVLGHARSGFLLLFPFFGTDIAEMQLAQVVHAVVAVLFVALILGHIYIGTLGMEGAFEAMGTGEVDLNWAKEHHDLWLAQQFEDKNRQGQPSATPAE